MIDFTKPIETTETPVKTCNNCRHDRNGVCAVEDDFGFDENGDCQDWEIKQ